MTVKLIVLLQDGEESCTPRLASETQGTGISTISEDRAQFPDSGPPAVFKVSCPSEAHLLKACVHVWSCKYSGFSHYCRVLPNCIAIQYDVISGKHLRERPGPLSVLDICSQAQWAIITSPVRPTVRWKNCSMYQ
jgi:hypothetical protein